ncbi:MAG: DUF4384 domain-containing protein [Geminicoccaceae bacterium]
MPRLASLIVASATFASLACAELQAAPAGMAVVLAATAPGFATGEVIQQPTIDIPDGASVTFLLASGQTLTVKGPYAGDLARLRPSRASGIGALAGGGPNRSDIGGARSVATAAGGTSDLLTIDLLAGGVWCLPKDATPRLSRPSDPVFQIVEVADEASGQRVQLSWDKQEVLAWPAELPASAARLTVTSLRTGAERRVELRQIAEPGRNDAARAATLALAGCSQQASATLERLREATVPLDIYVASDRGRYPSYRQGEPVELVVQTNHDAFVYCVLRDGRGQVLPLFPPQPAQAEVRNGVPLRLPSAASPFALRAGPSLDGAEARCIASEHDLAAELPELAAARGPIPLTDATVAALDDALADPRQGRVVMAQIILRLVN